MVSCKALSSLRTTLTALGDLFMPRRCLACGRILGAREHDLCLYCRADLPLTHYWSLPHNPMADRFNLLIQRDIEERLAERGAEHTAAKDAAPDAAGGRPPAAPEPYAYAAALFFYHSEAGYRRIPQAIKYKRAVDAGVRFGRLLGAKLAGAAHLKDIDAVVPVPLHWRRRWRRGYNQAEILAREVARALNVRMFPYLLTRRRATRTQTRLAVGDKARNVSGAFRLRPGAGAILSACGGTPPDGDARRPHILLVDDVFTTGATLHACYRVLRDALPEARISIATLAVVGP